VKNPPPETLRLVLLAGLLAWLLVGLSATLGGVGRPSAFAVWLSSSSPSACCSRGPRLRTASIEGSAWGGYTGP